MEDLQNNLIHLGTIQSQSRVPCKQNFYKRSTATFYSPFFDSFFFFKLAFKQNSQKISCSQPVSRVEPVHVLRCTKAHKLSSFILTCKHYYITFNCRRHCLHSFISRMTSCELLLRQAIYTTSIYM